MSRLSNRLSIALLMVAAFALTSCGGGSSNSSSPAATGCANIAGLATSFGNPTGANVVPMTIDGGPVVSGASLGTINQGYVTITICVPGTTSCQSIDHVWVDTGSSGLRLFPGTVASTLPLSMDSSGNPIGNCGGFVNTYTWGALRTADITIGGETAPSVPVQVIGDTAVPSAAPTSCSNGATAMSNPTQLGANGLLGIGVFLQDCGSFCAPPNAAGNGTGFYYSCPTGPTCTPTTVAVSGQLENVVGFFTTVDNGTLDNNGVLIQIPQVPAQGQATAGGWLIFGINTQTNNQLGSALVFEVGPSTSSQASFINTTTTYGSTANPSSYIDSGSNGWFFNDPALTNCSGNNGFFCATASLSATMMSYLGSTSTTSNTYGFCVQNFNTLSGTFAAFNDVGGPGGAGTFDWGLPFFYGRSVFTALENATIAGNNGPFFAASTP